MGAEKGERTMNRRKQPVTDIDRELEELLRSHKTVIKVFGTGGAGNNTVTRLMQVGIEEVETYAVNTDAQDLLYAEAHQKVLIGRNITGGLGAGSDPKTGEEAAREDEEVLRQMVSNADMVFVTCGLGGGTGTGSAPILAELARSSGALTISIVTLPFAEEGVLRWNNAQYGLERLRKNSDTLIVIQNDKLWEIVPDVPLDEAFKVADEILVSAVKGITELVTQKGLINLDFADVRTIMKDGGTALIGMGESDSPDRAIEAVERAIENPLIDLDITGAKSALMNITGGRDLTVKDAKIAMQTLARKLDDSARIIWGAHIHPDMESKVRVMIIATGLRDSTTEQLFRTDKGRKTRGKKPSAPPAPAGAGEPEKGEVKIEMVEKEDESSAEDSVGHAKKIFREIMEEESEADLRRFRESVDRLKRDVQDREAWEMLKQSCSSISSTAQMFDFDEIADFMTMLEDLIEELARRERSLGDRWPLFERVPEAVHQMIVEDAAAPEAYLELRSELELLLAEVRSEEAGRETTDRSAAESGQDELIELEEELDESDLSVDTDDKGNGKPAAESEKDDVEFLGKLLHGDDD
jgi:cell division protein FtsZ